MSRRPPEWKTQDGRTIQMCAMSDSHLENTIQYLERRGVTAGLLTPAQRDNDPVAKAEFLLSGLNEFTVDKYRQLLAERKRRKKALLATREAMAATRPGQEVSDGNRAAVREDQEDHARGVSVSVQGVHRRGTD